MAEESPEMLEKLPQGFPDCWGRHFLRKSPPHIDGRAFSESHVLTKVDSPQGSFGLTGEGHPLEEVGDC